MFKAELECIKWRKIFGTIKLVNNEVMIHCDQDGMLLRCGNEKSHIQLNLNADAFNEYEFDYDDECILGIDLDIIIKIIYKANHDDLISFYKDTDEDDDNFSLRINSFVTITEKKLISDYFISASYFLPSTNYDTKIKMSPLKLNRICYNFIKSEKILIKVFCESRTNLTFSQITSNGIDKFKTIFNQSTGDFKKDIQIKFNRKVDDKYLLSDLFEITDKIKSFSPQIDLKFFNNETLKIESKLENLFFDDNFYRHNVLGKLNFYLFALQD